MKLLYFNVPGFPAVHGQAVEVEARGKVPRGVDRPEHELVLLPLLPPPRLRRPRQARARRLRIPNHCLPIVDAQGKNIFFSKIIFENRVN